MEGRLLRTRFVPDPAGDILNFLTPPAETSLKEGDLPADPPLPTDAVSPSGMASSAEKKAATVIPAPESYDGYYENWVLLDDERQIPVRLLTRTIPSGFLPDSEDTNPPKAMNDSGDPENTLPARLRHERISADGVYYRQASYNAGDDFYNSPIIVAFDFRVLSAPTDTADRADGAGGVSSLHLKIAALAVLFVLWFFLRFVLLRKKRGRSVRNVTLPRPDASFRFDSDDIELLKNSASFPSVETDEAEKLDKTGKIGESDNPTEPAREKNENDPVRHFAFAFLLFAALTGGMASESTSPIAPQDTPTADHPDSSDSFNSPDNPEKAEKAESAAGNPENGLLPMNATFWREIAGIDLDALTAATPEDDAFRNSLRSVLDRLERNIPLGLLHRHLPPEEKSSPEETASAEEETLTRLFERFPENFGQPVRFRAPVEKIVPVDLTSPDPPDVNSVQTPPARVYRVTLRLPSGKPLTVYSPSIPHRWGPDGADGIGETADGIGVCFHHVPEPILAAARIGCRTEATPLGRLGCDVSLLDGVSALPPSALTEAKSEEERKRILMNFHLTTADRYPFYGLLAAMIDVEPETLTRELARQAKVSPAPTVVDLFNHPETAQGVLVSLNGHVRRARKIVVDDPEIRELTGLDHYYELYLFTSDSQDYPILFCTPELPISMKTIPPSDRSRDFSPQDGAKNRFESKGQEGKEPSVLIRRLPVGSGDDYREEVRLTGFLYKPWAYKVDAANSPYASPDDETGKSWITVPLMTGGPGDWFPDESVTNPESGGSPGILIGFAAALVIAALLYFTIRPKSKPIEFRLGGQESPSGPFSRLRSPDAPSRNPDAPPHDPDAPPHNPTDH